MEKTVSNSDSYLGKECFWVDKVTHSKKFDGTSLGECIKEGVDSLHKLPIVWFEKSFLGTTWQYKSDVKTLPEDTEKHNYFILELSISSDNSVGDEVMGNFLFGVMDVVDKYGFHAGGGYRPVNEDGSEYGSEKLVKYLADIETGGLGITTQNEPITISRVSDDEIFDDVNEGKTVDDFIKELQNLKPELRSKPLKIQAPNGLMFEPKVRRLLSEHKTIFDEVDNMIVTWE